jgi:hypothetical protein
MTIPTCGQNNYYTGKGCWWALTSFSIGFAMMAQQVLGFYKIIPLPITIDVVFLGE